MSDYAAYRADRMRAGEEYQDFVVDLMFKTLGWPIMQHVSARRQIHTGESASRVEIKFQDRYKDTGNLWIEVAEKATPRPGGYAPSGITRRQNDNAIFLVTGDYATVFLFAVRHLWLLAASQQYPILENNTKTSRGFLLPDRHARVVADHVWTKQVADNTASTGDPTAPFGRVTEEELRDIGRVCFGIKYDDVPKIERV